MGEVVKKIIMLLVVACIAVYCDTTDYMRVVLATQPTHLIQYLPLNDATGTTALDYSGNGRNGAFAACTLNQVGFKTGEKSVRFNGVNAYLNPLSASLISAFNTDEGSLILWVKSTVTPWGGSNNPKVIAKFYYSATNYIQINATNTYLQMSNVHNGVTTQYSQILATLGFLIDDWFSMSMTWSKTDNKLHFYVNGARVIGPVDYSGWGAGALQTSTTSIGNSAAQYFFNGYLSHFALWNIKLSNAEITKLADVNKMYSSVAFGNSITAGQSATDVNHQWVTLLANKQNIMAYKNQGISGTILQNTPAVIFSNLPQTNNGRGRFDTAICKYQPDYVFILYGLNDLRCSDTAITVEKYATQYNFIVDSLIKAGIDKNKIVLGSPPLQKTYTGGAPFNGGSIAKHLLYVAAVKSVAQTNHVKYADVYNYMKTHGDTALVSADNIHPNDLGHAAIANSFYNALKKQNSQKINFKNHFGF